MIQSTIKYAICNMVMDMAIIDIDCNVSGCIWWLISVIYGD